MAVDPVAGKLYWSSSQEPYRLQRADLDGSNPEELFDLEPYSPIDVDPQGEKIYWAIPSYFPQPQRADSAPSGVHDIGTIKKSSVRQDVVVDLLHRFAQSLGGELNVSRSDIGTRIDTMIY